MALFLASFLYIHVGMHDDACTYSVYRYGKGTY